MTISKDAYRAAKFIWETPFAFKDVQSLHGCSPASVVASDVGSHGIASPLVSIMAPRISRSSRKTSSTLVRDLVESSEGRLVLQLEGPPFECYAYLLELCQHIPASGVLQVSRPQYSATEIVNSVKAEMKSEFENLCRVCFLNGVIAEDSCARAGAFFALLLSRYQSGLKFILYDIFSIASLVDLYHNSNPASVPNLKSSDAFPAPVQLAERIDAEQLKTIFVLVPFKLDRDSCLTTAGIPDVSSTVVSLFAEGRLEVTDATLVVWACYPRELAARSDFSRAATERQLREELEPHIERLRDLPPIGRVSGSGSGSSESCGVRPFREVEFRMCPYDQWHAGGIAEIPEEVWEVILKEIDAEARTGEGRTAEGS